MFNNKDYDSLSKAIQIATQAHADQTDKGNNPYIFHPLRVMLSLNSLTEQICGVLHDVVEDTDITLDGLREQGFSDEVVEILDLLTRRNGETYDEFIDRLLYNEIACRVKLADLKDNMSAERLIQSSLFKRYEKAFNKIARYMASGVFDNFKAGE